MRILIVEDEIVSRKHLELTLKKLDHEVTAVDGGRAAWELLEEGYLPEILLLDWMMPEMNGLELCKKIREGEFANYIYIIFVTGKIDKEDVVEGLSTGADDYITKPFDFQDLKARLAVGERIMSLHSKVKFAFEENERLLESIHLILLKVDEKDNLARWNAAAQDVFGVKEADVLGKAFLGSKISWDWEKVLLALEKCRQTKATVHLDSLEFDRPDGEKGYLDIALNTVRGDLRDRPGVLLIGSEVTERIKSAEEKNKLEMQLAQAQKLESIGQLAAGIAHEINTPTQYIGDNVRFLKDAFEELSKPLSDLWQVLGKSNGEESTTAIADLAKASLKELDFEYLNAEVPDAVEQTLSGVEQVSRIVRAMKAFSHPGSEEKSLTDINKAVENTATVSRNEWKYVADVEFDLDQSMPLVPCFPNELNQTILNLIVNAAQAIADNVAEGKKGKITVKTAHDDKWTYINVSDTGKGVPEEIRDKIFDPFFTTKEVGKGTGQGLSICHSVIVQKHGGLLDLETKVGKGSTFKIQLPMAEE